MEIKELQNRFTTGRVVFIGIRPKRLVPVKPLEEVEAVEGRGLVGDRYNTSNGARQVTLIQAESLNAVGSYLNRTIEPEMVRRNIVLQGINLIALKGHRFTIGGAVLEYTGECHPCSRMEEALGHGGYNAMRGHGGITARIVQSGSIKIGDFVTVLPALDA